MPEQRGALDTFLQRVPECLLRARGRTVPLAEEIGQQRIHIRADVPLQIHPHVKRLHPMLHEAEVTLIYHSVHTPRFHQRVITGQLARHRDRGQRVNQHGKDVVVHINAIVQVGPAPEHVPLHDRLPALRIVVGVNLVRPDRGEHDRQVWVQGHPLRRHIPVVVAVGREKDIRELLCHLLGDLVHESEPLLAHAGVARVALPPDVLGEAEVPGHRLGRVVDGGPVIKRNPDRMRHPACPFLLLPDKVLDTLGDQSRGVGVRQVDHARVNLAVERLREVFRVDFSELGGRDAIPGRKIPCDETVTGECHELVFPGIDIDLVVQPPGIHVCPQIGVSFAF